jgi:IS5 family transposase
MQSSRAILMRNVFNPQLSIGQTDIADIVIDISSRDDIPMLLLGLQHIYCHQPLREAVFKILAEVVPTKAADETCAPVATDKGRPGMDQWRILVLGSLRLALNADYDRIHELANQHKTLREMLGHSGLEADYLYRLQTVKDNLKLFTPERMQRINIEVIRAGHAALGLKTRRLWRGGWTHLS